MLWELYIHNNMYVYAWVGLGHYRVQNTSRLYLNNNLLGKLQIVPKNGTYLLVRFKNMYVILDFQLNYIQRLELWIYQICTDEKLKRGIVEF